MRRTILALSACALAAALVFSRAPAQEPPGVRGDAPHAWEYRTVNLHDVVKFDQAINDPAAAIKGMDARFNELGRDGWELATSLPGVAVFKRPKR